MPLDELVGDGTDQHSSAKGHDQPEHSLADRARHAGVNPQGVHVVPSRSRHGGARPRLPLAHGEGAAERGRIGIFTGRITRRSWRSGPAEWLEAQRLPPGPRDEGFWQQRYEDINASSVTSTETGRRSSSFLSSKGSRRNDPRRKPAGDETPPNTSGEPDDRWTPASAARRLDAVGAVVRGARRPQAG